MKNDGKSNPYMRWSAIVYIAYWSICLSGLCALVLFGVPLKGIWRQAGRIWGIMKIFQVYTFFPLLAALVYARELFVRRSIIVFAAWIWSMMLPLVIDFGFHYFAWHSAGKFLILIGGSVILPIALSVFSIKRKTTLTLLAIYALYFLEWFAMVVMVGLY